MGFLFGAGGANAARDLNIQKQLAKEMLNRFHISPENARIGLIQYGRVPRLVARLDSYTDKRTVNYTIDSLTGSQGGSQLDKAIEMAQTNLFNARYGARRGIPKTLVVFTNKEVDASSEATARKLRDVGVKVIVIGVGSEVDKDQLKGLAQSDDEMFVVTSLESVQNAVNDIAKAAKPGMFNYEQTKTRSWGKDVSL